MSDKKFNAILAKNEIARKLANLKIKGIDITYIQNQLECIENYIGTANQPTVEDIVNNNSNLDKNFNI